MAEKDKAQDRPKVSGGITVSSRQRGNPILKSIRLVPWEFSDTIIPDYILGITSFTSFRNFHDTT